jgi:hypothetical protein
MAMDNHMSAVGCILAVVGLSVTCSQATPSRPDAQSVVLQTDALSLTNPSNSTGCLGPSQVIDIGPPPRPANLDVTGCLWHTLDHGRSLAVFKWSNQTGQAQVAPNGPTNHVSPGADSQGQPISFSVDYSGNFAVPFDGTPETWTILGQSVTVSQASQDCGSACTRYEQYGCMDCGGRTWDLCAVACGDGVCDSSETCSACPADCDCSALVPLVDCVLPIDGGRKLVSFGYSNSAATGAGLEVGPDNQFLTGQKSRGQPIHFDVGAHHSVFQVTYIGPDVTWMLAGNTVSAPANAPLCPQNCPSACPRGTLCVADQCQGSCGDGLCVEGCDDCPDDCACGGDLICLGTSCAIPPRCGGDGPECGVIEQLGVSKDCGPCPDGQGCNSLHLCVSLCSVDSGV